MNETGKGWRAFCKRTMNVLTLGGLGITARLSLAFAAVAGIAVTAPFVVDRAATVILQRDVVSRSAPPAVEPASRTVSSQIERPVVATPTLPIAPLRTALRLHDDAVRRLAETD